MPVLIIEDHVDNLELMSYLLRAFGYATLAATDGITGLDLARSENPDLILCDVQLPGIGGLDVARRLRQDARLQPIPLVAITALAMVGDRERILAAGFDGYIPKPINPETFMSSVEAFLKPGARQRPDRHPATASEPEPERTRAAPVASHGTILVVDNVPANLELAQSIFEPSGFRVILAGSMSAAMAMAKQARPDLVLSDVNMPEGTGFELARRMKSDPQLQSIPIVLISATLPREITAEVALAAGAQKLIRRPIDPSALLEEIEDCMEAARRAAY
jgi:two-component system cell cycle response regulator